MRAVWFAAVALAMIALPSTASAGDNDFKLHRLADFECTDNSTGLCTAGSAIPDTEAFKALSTGLGMMFAPAFLSPAETSGQAGFALGVGTKISIPQNGEHWRALNGVQTGDTDPGIFSLLEISASKGLPWSFELDGVMNWLIDSEMIYLGGGLKWALTEGWAYVPDLAVRGHGGIVGGAPDMNIATAGVDVSLSKAFGLAGFANLTPYAGYSHVWTITSSRVIDADPGDGRTPTGNYEPEFVFRDSEDDSTFIQDSPRGFVGMRFVVDYFSFTVEGSWASEVQNYAFSIGADL